MNLSTKGAILAMAAASLVASGVVSTAFADNPAKTQKKEMCKGGNACKGKSECKTATSSCKGGNDCKGKGWTVMTAEECKKAGGTIEKSPEPEDKENRSD
jgi:uncharacterized membrane protein